MILTNLPIFTCHNLKNMKLIVALCIFALICIAYAHTINESTTISGTGEFSTSDPTKLTFARYQEHRGGSVVHIPKEDDSYRHQSTVNRYKDRIIHHVRKEHSRKNGRKIRHTHNHHRHRQYYLKHSSEDMPSESDEMYDENETGSNEDHDESIHHRIRPHQMMEKISPSDPINLINYKLFTKTSPHGVEISKDGSSGIAHWNKDQAVKLILHGYYPHSWKSMGDILDKPFQIIAAYLKSNSNANLIMCNWTVTASLMPLDVLNTQQLSIKQVAEDVANFLINLKGSGKIKLWSDVHVIGFSLGAHIAGHAGWYIQKYNGGLKLGRITGLDPANAGFDTLDGNIPQDTSGILDRSDADFVDIIHCNQGSFSNNEFGSTMIAGHADFYPNGGHKQPTCIEDTSPLCSHEYCLTLYTSSFANPAFKACQCSNWRAFLKWRCNCINQPVVVMGESCPHTARGLYFLKV